MDTKKLIKKQLRDYILKVNSVIPVEKAYLVGSWASGKAKRDSDVDLLVLSSAFEKMDFDDRLSLLYRKTVGLDFDIHIHPVTRKELNRASKLTSLGMMRVGRKLSLA